MRCQSCMAENAATRRFLRRVRCSAAFTVLGLWLRERGLRQVLRRLWQADRGDGCSHATKTDGDTSLK